MKVSVAIAAFNGEAHIQAQIDSVLSQLNDDDEIIISDDCSSDNTVAVIKTFNDKRIKIFENKKTAGLIKNFENALQQATGDIIFLSDQDDVWLPGKVQTCKKYLEHYDLVVTDCAVTDKDLKLVAPSYFALINSGTGLLKNLRQNTYVGCCMAFNKKLLKLALPFPEKIPMHDIWLGFISGLFFKTYFIKEQLLLYRRHNKNASSSSVKSSFLFRQKVYFRYNTIKYLPLLLKRKIKSI